MDFKKKLKTRLYIAIGYTFIGIVMIIAANVMRTDNVFLSSFGLCLAVCGLTRIRRYFLITKNDETIRKQRIAETDERNLSIMYRAKSAAFNICVLLMGTAVIVLEILNRTEPAKILSYTVCAAVFVYWVSYWVIRKKS